MFGWFKTVGHYERKFQRMYEAEKQASPNSTIWQRLNELNPFKFKRNGNKENSVTAATLNHTLQLSDNPQNEDYYAELYKRYVDLEQQSENYINAKNNDRWAGWRSEGKERLGYAKFLKSKAHDIFDSEITRLLESKELIEALRFCSDELKKEAMFQENALSKHTRPKLQNNGTNQIIIKQQNSSTSYEKLKPILKFLANQQDWPLQNDSNLSDTYFLAPEIFFLVCELSNTILATPYKCTTDNLRCISSNLDSIIQSYSS